MMTKMFNLEFALDSLFKWLLKFILANAVLRLLSGSRVWIQDSLDKTIKLYFGGEDLFVINLIVMSNLLEN